MFDLAGTRCGVFVENSLTPLTLGEQNLPEVGQINVQQILKEIEEGKQRVPQNLHEIPSEDINDGVCEVRGEQSSEVGEHCKSFL